jgi:lipoyl(octanoyl) transferase
LVWHYIIDNYKSAKINMAYDEALLNLAQKNYTNPIIRFYGWELQACSYGYGQNIIDKKELFKKQFGKNIVKRPTGGGTVFHNYDISYSIIADVTHEKLPNIRETFGLFHKAIAVGLNKMGYDVTFFDKKNKIKGFHYCFDNPVLYDIIDNNKKIVGSAQRRKENFLLQQGSIFLPGIETRDENIIKILAENIIFGFSKVLSVEFEERKFTDIENSEALKLIDN